MVVAGEVEAVGKAVNRLKVGDQICAYDLRRISAYAEYACVPETCAMAFKPSTLTYEEVAAIPFGGITALSFLQQGKIHNGQKVLIYGASGSVGTFAVQLAKYFGAVVTGICGTSHVEVCDRWGPIRSSTTHKRILPKAVRPMTSFLTLSARVRFQGV